MNRFAFKKIILTGIMLIGIMSVSACGKKPAHVDPPPDLEDDTFPHQVYPNPKNLP